MDLNYLRNILNNLIKRIQHRNLPNEFDLKRQLHFLDEREKFVIKTKIKNEVYDIGTFSVIKILKNENILGICEYLEAVGDEYEVLQIITDLLDDSVKSVDLLSEVLTNAKFQSQIDQALNNYVQDLIQHPELIKTELILSTYKALQTNVFHSSILKKFINLLLHYEDERSYELPNVISSQLEWNKKFKDFSLISKIFMTIMPVHSEFIVNEIMPAVNEKINWFFLLLILNYLKDDQAGYGDMKSE
jgi:hypothetical protein